jgi:hypothetical protein
VPGLQADGATLAPDPGDFVTATTAKDAVNKAGAWTFPTPGKCEASCTSKSLGGSNTAAFAVAAKASDPALSRLAAGLDQATTHLEAVIALQKDPAKQKEALAAFDKIGLTLGTGLGEGGKVLLPLPKGLPSKDKVVAKGLTAGPDDAAWQKGLGDLETALKAMQAALAKIDPKKPTIGDEAAFKGAQAQIDVAQAALAKLKPSPLAVFEALRKLDAVVAQLLPQVAQAHHTFLSKLLHEAEKAPPPPCTNCFSLVGLAVSFAVQSVLASMPSYTSILKDMGWHIGEILVTLTIKEVIDNQFPPVSGGPSLTGIVAFGQAISRGCRSSFSAATWVANPLSAR